MDAPIPTDRAMYLGSSDAGPLLGLSPWRTPLEVWLQKTGQAEADAPDPDRERILRRGKLMEPVVVDMLIAEHGIKITRRSSPASPNRYVDPSCPFLAAEIDFEWEVTPEIVASFPEQIAEELIGTTQNGEVKTVHPFGAGIYGAEHTDEIPIYHAAQAFHGLMVTGRALTLFPVLVGSDNLLLYWIKRDDETIGKMRDRLVRFWNENVLARVPPDPIQLSDIYALFKRRAATRIAADDEVAGMIRTLKSLSDRKSTTEEAIDAVKFEIGCRLLGQAEIENPTAKERSKHIVLVDGRPALTVGLEEQQRIDQDKLRRDYPEAAAASIKTIRFFKYSLSRTKT